MSFIFNVFLAYVLVIAVLSFWFGYMVGEYRTQFPTRKE